jgi:hypothetical protein
MAGPGEKKGGALIGRLGALIELIATTTGLKPDKVAWGLLLAFMATLTSGTAGMFMLINSAQNSNKSPSEQQWDEPVNANGAAARMHRQRITPANKRSGMAYVGPGSGTGQGPASSYGQPGGPLGGGNTQGQYPGGTRTAGAGPGGLMGGESLYNEHGEEEQQWRQHQERQRRKRAEENTPPVATDYKRLPNNFGQNQTQQGGGGTVTGGGGAQLSGGGFGAGNNSGTGNSNRRSGDEEMVLGDAAIPDVGAGREVQKGMREGSERLKTDRVGVGSADEQSGYAHEEASGGRYGGSGQTNVSDHVNQIYLDPAKAHAIDDGKGPHLPEEETTSQ